MPSRLSGTPSGFTSPTHRPSETSGDGQLGQRRVRIRHDKITSHLPANERPRRVSFARTKKATITPLRIVREWIYKLLDKIAPSLMVRIPRQELAEFKNLVNNLQPGNPDGQAYLIKRNNELAKGLRDPVGRLEFIKCEGLSLNKLEKAAWGRIQVSAPSQSKVAAHSVYRPYYERVISPEVRINAASYRDGCAPPAE